MTEDNEYKEKIIKLIREELDETVKYKPDTRIAQAYWQGKEATIRWMLQQTQ